jgi:hypothetical protein
VSFSSRLASEAAEGGFDYLAQRVAGNAAALRDAWLASLLVFWGEPWKPGFMLASALGIAAGAAALARATRGTADGLYVLGFVAVLLAWPFPGQMMRLALPIVPLLLAQMLWEWAALLRLATPETAARRAPFAAVLPLAVCLPALLFYLVPRAYTDDSDAAQRPGHITEYYRIPSLASAYSNATAQLAIIEDLRRVGASTPAGARVMWYMPNYVALLAGREGVPLERPRDLDDLKGQVRATRADYIYLAEMHPRDSARRDGHPLAPLAQARELGRVAWQRASPAGTIHAVLIQVDPRLVGGP